MDSTNNNNNQLLFLCELKELRKELSTIKKRIVLLEDSHEAQQERLDILERENHALKTQLNIDGNTAVASVMKRKRTGQEQDNEEEIESKSTSASDGEKKIKKTNNNNNKDDDDDDEAVVLSRHDNGDSFDSLSDDLLHKIVEFNGNCYSVYGSINKRCRNIYDVKEYKLKKETCLYGYGTVDMMLEQYLHKRRLDRVVRYLISWAVFIYNRLDAIDWIIQLGDDALLKWVCYRAAYFGKTNILSNVFCKLNLTMLDQLLNDTELCRIAAFYGQLETLKWLRRYGSNWSASAFTAARYNGHDKIVQYLLLEGCPEHHEERDDSSESEQFDSEDEDGDY